MNTWDSQIPLTQLSAAQMRFLESERARLVQSLAALVGLLADLREQLRLRVAPSREQRLRQLQRVALQLRRSLLAYSADLEEGAAALLAVPVAACSEVSGGSWERRAAKD